MKYKNGMTNFREEIGEVRFLRKPALFFASLFVVLVLTSFTGCGGGGSGTNSPVGANTVAYSLTGLSPGTTYYVAVSAIDNSGNESVKSPEVSGQAAGSGAAGLLNLEWNKNNEPDLDHYLVYYGETSGVYGSTRVVPK